MIIALLMCLRLFESEFHRPIASESRSSRERCHARLSLPTFIIIYLACAFDTTKKLDNVDFF